MQFCTFVSSEKDLNLCSKSKLLKEVLLEPALLSRLGTLSKDRIFSLASQAHKLNLRVVLVWDILMNESLIKDIIHELTSWDLSAFDSVRVVDIGAAQWLKIKYPHLKLQLNLEGHSHNKEALLTWSKIFASTLERIILSIQLPEHKLIEYCQSLSVQCEILGAGSILLLYTPRHLLREHLNVQENNTQTEIIQAFAASEESNYRPFPMIENIHGTFMFLDKDQFILDKLEKLDKAGLFSTRIDLRHLSSEGHSANNIDIICQQYSLNTSTLREKWKRKTQQPFFKSNKTTVLFSKIRSKQRQHRDDTCLAEVLYSKNGHYVIFRALQSFEVSKITEILLPSRQKLDIPSYLKLRNLEGHNVDFIELDQIFTTDWFKHACSGTLLKTDLIIDKIES